MLLRAALLVMPVVGGAIAGLLVKTFAPEAEGTGTDGYIDAFHNKAGAMRARVPLVKSLATLSTLASGGSAVDASQDIFVGGEIGGTSGAGTMLSHRANRTPASKHSVCVNATERKSPSSCAWLTSGAIP